MPDDSATVISTSTSTTSTSTTSTSTTSASDAIAQDGFGSVLTGILDQLDRASSWLRELPKLLSGAYAAAAERALAELAEEISNARAVATQLGVTGAKVTAAHYTTVGRLRVRLRTVRVIIKPELALGRPAPLPSTLGDELTKLHKIITSGDSAHQGAEKGATPEWEAPVAGLLQCYSACPGKVLSAPALRAATIPARELQLATMDAGDALAKLARARSAKQVKTAAVRTSSEELLAAVRMVRTKLVALWVLVAGEAHGVVLDRADEQWDQLWTALDGLASGMLAAITAPALPAHGVPSIGFEYEPDSIKIANATTGSKDQIPSKAVLAIWQPPGRPGVTLESDGDHIEFVTDPARSLDQVRAQFAAIAQACVNIGHHEQIVLTPPGTILSDVDGSSLNITQVSVTGGTQLMQAGGRLQATCARDLANVPGMIGELALNKSFGPGLRKFVESVDFNRSVSPAKGFQYLVCYYIWALQGRGAKDGQGPKVMLSVMCRTSFRALFESLDANDQNTVKTWFATLPDQERNARLTRGYKGPAGAHYPGPTVGAWLDSITAGDPTDVDIEPVDGRLAGDSDWDGEGPRGPHHDLMSPPVGYRAHRQGRHFTYAMGRYGCTTPGEALFEHRAVVEGKVSPARLGNAVTDFARLHVPEEPAVLDHDVEMKEKPTTEKTTEEKATEEKATEEKNIDDKMEETGDQ